MQTATVLDFTKRSVESIGIFRSFFEHSGMCLVRLDTVLRVREANQEFCDQFGTSAADARQRSIFDFVHPSGHERLRAQLEQLRDGRRQRITEQVLGLRLGSVAFSGQLTAIEIDDSGLILLINPDDAPVSDGVVTDGTKVLSALDARILEGIAAGVSTIQLASKLYLSRQGVEYRVGILLRRLRVPNRAALVSKAYSMGVLSMGIWPPHVLPNMVG